MLQQNQTGLGSVLLELSQLGEDCQVLCEKQQYRIGIVYIHMVPTVMGIGMLGYAWVSFKLRSYTDKMGVPVSCEHIRGIYVWREGLITRL